MAKAPHAIRYRKLPGMLRAMRQEAGLTQRELAGKLRIGQSLIHKTEVGERRADITEFLDWCVACDVDPVTAFERLIRSRGA